MALITQIEIDRAAENGINYHTLCTRVYTNGWDVEEAITKPLKHKRTLWAKYKDSCIKNGISCSAFYNRINRGWEPEKAASAPSK